jgi:hypothetical protein
MHGFDDVLSIRLRFGTQAPRDNDFAILSQSFTNGIEAFFNGGVYESAGVDDDQVSASKGFRGLIALSA